MKRIVLGLLAATALAFPALADDLKPALLYDLGGKFDKSFNEAAYNGAEKFKKETGIAYVDFEISNASQREQALRRFAEDGRNPIIMTGFSFVDSLKKVAADYPDIKFEIIDDVVDAPNVRSVTFKENEGSYVVGVLAAMASKSHKVGFIGGMDVPLIRKFGCGYVGGAKAAGATDVVYNMTGDTPAAWNDPAKGGEIAKTQMDQGADVIYAAAGGAGVGVLQTAADAGNAQAQMNMARLSFLGIGRARDDADGARWTRMAADGGAPNAQALLGVLYLGGIGVPQDFDEGVKWLTPWLEQSLRKR